MKKHNLSHPYRQGDLDSLCGIYSIINAVKKLCGPLEDDEVDEMFAGILELLEPRCPLKTRIGWGSSQGDVSVVLDRLVCRQYPIRKQKPYRRASDLSLDEFWSSVQHFLVTHQGVVLTGIGGYHDHWTIVHRATDHFFILYDSSDIQRISRQRCTLNTKNPDNHRHILYPIQTYFLWVEHP